MWILKCSFLFCVLISHASAATEPTSCTEKKLNVNALTDKMKVLQDHLKDKNLSSSDRKQMVKKTLDEMNCQLDITANEPNLANSPSRWKSIQYQDLLSTALTTDCDEDKQSFAIKSAGAGQELLSTEATKHAEDFLSTYCAKKTSK